MLLRRIARQALLLLLGLALLVSAAWGVLALAYFDHLPPPARTGLAAGFAAVAVVALAGYVTARWRRAALLVYAGMFAVLLVAWRGIEPSNDRDWRPEVAMLPYATVDGERVTVHNVRNFDYRSETDFTPAWYTRTFDLRGLEGVDLVASYWMGPHIAHTFLTFAFAGDQHLAISIEARKEAQEGYSSIQGFFRQYEIYYVVADERDVIRVRTNYRRDPPEDVYVYRLRGTPEAARRLFLDYVERINALHEHPAFYNTLTTNCTTAIWTHARINPGRVPFSWKILASGHVPEFLYERGRLDTTLPFAELQHASHVNAAAHAADHAEDFSRRIRTALPSLPE